MCARSFAGSGRYHRVERSGSARAGVPTERQTSDPKTSNLCGGWILGTLKLTKKSGDSCTWNSEKNNKTIFVPGTPSRLVRVLGAICS